ncbi:MAG: ABC transporter permease [Acidimicrobiales bacterium]
MSKLVVVRRVLEILITLFLVTLVTYFFTSKLPGNEASVICGPAGPACVAHESALLYLNHPFIDRYFHWLGNLFSGSFGLSAAPPEPIATLLKQSYPITLELVIFSQLIAVVVAVPLAMYSAVRPNKIFDRMSTAATFATLSLPAFIVGPLLRYFFTVELPWFPGAGSPMPSIGVNPAQNIYVMFLPSLTIAVGSIAVYQRLLRADMIATLEEDFIVMARAKGLTTWRILFRHALRPSTFTVMTVGGVQIGSLIVGAIIGEQVFGLTGLGYQLVLAVTKADLPTVQIITVIVAVAYILMNLLIDFLYTVIDPRVRRARTT